MGELIDLDEYRERQKAIAEEKEREREQRELDQTIEEMEMLKRILDDITKDLPPISYEMHIEPIEPDPGVFLNKFNINDYLMASLPPIDPENENDDDDKT